MMQAAETRVGDDAMSGRDAMSGQCRLVRRIIGQSRAQRSSLSGIIQSRHSRLTVPIKRSQYALSCGARTGVLSTCNNIE